MLAKSSKDSSRHHQKPHPKKTWRWWLTVAAVPAWVYVGFLVSQTIVVAIVQILETFGVSLVDINPIILNSVAAVVLYSLSILVVVGVPRLLNKYRVSLKTIGLHRLPYWRDIGMTLIGLVVYIVISAVLTYIAIALFSGFNSTQAQDVGFNGLVTRVDFLLAFVTLVVIGPLAEEILFRGFLFGTLRKMIPVWGAILLTSALFAFVHGQWNLAIDTFAMSVVACFLRVKSGSLWPSILLHVAKNGIAFYVLYILH